jgi:hypothetical protein
MEQRNGIMALRVANGDFTGCFETHDSCTSASNPRIVFARSQDGGDAGQVEAALAAFGHAKCGMACLLDLHNRNAGGAQSASSRGSYCCSNVEIGLNHSAEKQRRFDEREGTG